MALWLKQSTTVTVQFGPALDATNAVDLETGLATAMDNATTGIRLSKNGAAFADRGSATAPAYDAMGCYRVELSATDTGTLGTLRMIFEESATCLPIWQDFMIVSANTWDSFFGTDNLNTNAAEVGGQTASASGTVTFPATIASTTNITAGTMTTVTTATNLTNLPTIPANWITTAGITDGAYTAAKFAASSLNGKGDWNTTTPPTSAANATAVWEELTATARTAGTYGQLHKDNLDAAVTSRMATYTQPTGFLAATFPTTVASTTNITGGTITTTTNLTNLPSIPANWITTAGITDGAYTAAKFAAASLNGKGDWNTTTPPTAVAIADQVWDEEITVGHTTADSAGAKLNSAGGAADPWGTALPGAYGAGTAGNILGNRLDDTLTARTLASASYFDPAADTVANVTTVATTTDLTNLPAITANWITAAGITASALDGKGNWNTTTPPTAVAIADQVWDEEITVGHTTADSAGAKLNAAGGAADPWATAIPGAYGAGTAGNILGNRLDDTLTARTLATAAYFDPATDTVANVTTTATATNLTNLPTMPSNWVTAVGIAASALDGKGDWNTTTPPTAVAIADQVWDEEITVGHTTGDTAGAKLNASGDSADPWSIAIPGAYGAGTAGNILGNRLDATLTDRTLVAAAYFDPAVDTVATVTTVTTATNLTNLPTIPSNWITAGGVAASALNGKGDWNTTTPPTAIAIADQVWDEELTVGHTTVDTAGAKLNTSGSISITSGRVDLGKINGTIVVGDGSAIPWGP